jgi:uncharacterized SAM-binding protein YcdF (DUF218 family)
MMTDDEIAELVFVREDPVAADLAMVFAAANEKDLARRTRRGVSLYRDGFVPRLLLAGGGVLARACPEAKRMVEIARELEVPDTDLLVEDNSGNTFDNVRFSVALLRECGLLDKLTTVILVSSEWHMRRVLLTSKMFFPPSMRFVCCPTPQGCNRANWAASEACRRVVTEEALLLNAFLESGALRS